MTRRGTVALRSRLFFAILIAIVAIVTFFDALHVASNLTQTSDSAQAFVTGHAIATGNVFLAGWHFPIDNYYFTDSIPYAAAESVAGPRPWLLAVVPAFVYASLVLLALVLSARPAQPLRETMQTVAIILLLFGVPAWIGVWNPMLMSDMHMATAVAALAALALLARVASAEATRAIDRLAPAPAFLLVALAVSSDPFSLVFAFGPALAVLATGTMRNRQNARFTVVLLAAAITTGLLLPWIIAHFGGFTTENDVSPGFAPLARWWTNLLDMVSGALTLFGANPLDVQSLSDGLMLTIRSAVLALVLVALACVAGRLQCGQNLGLLDRLLFVGAAISLAVCVPSAQFAKGVNPETTWRGGPPMRFLVPAVLFVSILACRELASGFDFFPRSRVRAHRRGPLVALAGFALSIGTLQFISAAAVPKNSSEMAVTYWLTQHRFSEGAGEYWSANLLTAISGNSIGVRSMVADHGALVPYLWVEAKSFYARPPQFAVWKEPNPTGWTEAVVRATWPVCAIRFVAGYRIALLQTSGERATCSRP